MLGHALARAQDAATTHSLSGSGFLREGLGNEAEFVGALYRDDDVVTKNFG
jgi:hypothetical protein